MKILSFIGIPFRLILAVLFIIFSAAFGFIVLSIAAIVAPNEVKDMLEMVGEILVDTTLWVYKP